MKLTLKHWGALTLIVVLLLWQGLPAFNRWRADKLVDELCAKDSGIKVYESVTLPKERFNRWGQFEVSYKEFIKPTDEYYMEGKTLYYKKNGVLDTAEPRQDRHLEIRRYHDQVYRKTDNKLLGESISYSRVGGDAIGPWHISSYHCPANAGNTFLAQQVFKIDQKR